MYWMRDGHRMPSRPRTQEFSEQAALFAQKVRVARKRAGLSQLKLSEVAGVSYRQVQNIERNANNERPRKDAPQPANPKLDTIYALAAALEVEVAYLVDPRRNVEATR